MRSLSYQEADVFLLCFKLSDPISLHNARVKWAREIRQFRPDAPIVLCGCQGDIVSKADAEKALAVCCEIEAINYVETSAKLGEEVHEAFELCALAAIKNKRTSVNTNTNSSRGSKKKLNLSFSGSETSQMRHVEEDVFPDLHEIPAPFSPPRRRISQKSHRSSLGALKSPEMFTTSTAKSRSSAQLFIDQAPPPPPPSKGLIRRTSFRTQPPQVAPKTSTLQQALDLNMASTSLKSQGSTGSSSKASTDDTIPDTEDPELLNQLKFVSPKSGVFRPVETGKGASRRQKANSQNCNIM